MATYSAGFAKAADGIAGSGGFDAPEQWRFDWSKSSSSAEWLEQVPTFDGHNLGAPDTLEQLLKGVGAVLDGVGGHFTMNYAAVVVTAARTAGA